MNEVEAARNELERTEGAMNEEARSEAKRNAAAMNEASLNDGAMNEEARNGTERNKGTMNEEARNEAGRNVVSINEGAMNEEARNEATRNEGAMNEEARNEAERIAAARIEEAATGQGENEGGHGLADDLSDSDDEPLPSTSAPRRRRVLPTTLEGLRKEKERVRVLLAKYRSRLQLCNTKLRNDFRLYGSSDMKVLFNMMSTALDLFRQSLPGTAHDTDELRDVFQRVQPNNPSAIDAAIDGLSSVVAPPSG